MDSVQSRSGAVGSVLDWCTANYEFSTADIQRRRRRTAGAVLVTGVAYATAVVLMLVTDQPVIAIPISMAVFSLLLCAAALRVGISINIVANGTIAVNAIVLFGMLLITGGASVGFLMATPVVPTLAMLVADRRSVLVWSAMAVATILMVAVLTWLEFEFPVQPDPGQVAIARFPVAIVITGVFFGIAQLFLSDRLRAEKALKSANDELESRVKQRTVELRQVLAETEEASLAKSRFLAKMGHELRTPLNVVIGYSEILREDAQKAGQAETIVDLDKIIHASRQLLTMINDVLAISQIVTGEMLRNIEPIAVAELIAEVTETVVPLMERNSNRFEVTGMEGLGEMRSDPAKLRRALFNLLENAAKFTEAGEVTLEVGRETADGEDWLSFIVRDSGIGMSSEQQQRVFLEFAQADDTSTRKYDGTGLGLTISQRFCLMMGGDITIDSELGKGSVFTMRLPAVIAE